MIYSEIQDLTNAEAVAQYKDITHFPMPIGEVEFFLSQNGLRRVSAGASHDAAAGVAPGAAQVEAVDGRAVLC